MADKEPKCPECGGDFRFEPLGEKVKGLKAVCQNCGWSE